MNGKAIFRSLVVVAAVAIACLPSLAAEPAGETDEPDDMPSVLASPERPLAAGVIVATSPAAGTIEIRHRAGPLLNMEYMTTTFHVADPSMLLGRTAGDKIRFKVERKGQDYVVTRIENSN